MFAFLDNMIGINRIEKLKIYRIEEYNPYDINQL